MKRRDVGSAEDEVDLEQGVDLAHDEQQSQLNNEPAADDKAKKQAGQARVNDRLID